MGEKLGFSPTLGQWIHYGGIYRQVGRRKRVDIRRHPLNGQALNGNNHTWGYLQCDEIWSFVGAKQKNVKAMKAPMEGAGDCWTWAAIDADSS